MSIRIVFFNYTAGHHLLLNKTWVIVAMWAFWKLKNRPIWYTVEVNIAQTIYYYNHSQFTTYYHTFFLLNRFKCKIPFEGGVAEENTSLIVFLSANSEQKYEIEYEAGRIFIGKKNKKYCRWGGYFDQNTPHFRPLANHVLATYQCTRLLVFPLLYVIMSFPATSLNTSHFNWSVGFGGGKWRWFVLKRFS